MTWIKDEIIKRTDLYIKNSPKDERIDKGQFITPLEIANVMSNMFSIKGDSISILDPGAGSGVLTASLIQRFIEYGEVKRIKADLYENDQSIIDLLKFSMKTINDICSQNNIVFEYVIFEKNFITENKSVWNDDSIAGSYDYVICNPPYKKLKKSSPEAIVMDNIIFGQPNLYFLFMAMATMHLGEGAEGVFIVPRSFFNGSYFRKFREWLFNNSSIERIHHFESREKVFDGEILQETVILKIVKSENNQINITTSYDSNDICDAKSINACKDLIVSNNYDTIRLPLNEKDIWTITTVDNFKNTFMDLGIKFSTGPIVDFRNKEYLFKEKVEDSVPLIWSCNFSEHLITWPSMNTKFHQYIEVNNQITPYLLPKTDYILIKRFTNKEAKKPLKVNMFFSEDILSESFGIENHINYLKATEIIDRDALCGIAVLLSTQLYNDYFRIINGTTQINVSDLNSLSCPDLDLLHKLGKMYPFNDVEEEEKELIIFEILDIRRSAQG